MFFFLATRVEEKWGKGECSSFGWKRVTSNVSSTAEFPTKFFPWREDNHLSHHVRVLLPSLHHISKLLLVWVLVSFIANKMKGISKGFKYISQIFVVKEHDMEIGYPTDVKHVAHIGWDGSGCGGSAPSWMNEFKPGPDFSVPSLGNRSQSKQSSSPAVSSWSSRDFESSSGSEPASEMYREAAPTDLPKVPRKQKRRKNKTATSPRSPSSTSRSSRAAKMKAKYAESEAAAKR